MTDLTDDDLLDSFTGTAELPADENELLADLKEEPDDLFDEALGEEQNGKVEPAKPVVAPVVKEEVSASATRSLSSTNGSMTRKSERSGERKYCCYVGNITWWTTDADLRQAIVEMDLEPDLVDMKFFENRTNGSSKGYALMVFHSEDSVTKLTEGLPKRTIHNQQPMVLPYTKQSLARLEEASMKTMSSDGKRRQGGEILNLGTIRIGPSMNQMNRGPTMGGNIVPTVKLTLPTLMGGRPPGVPAPQPLMSLVTGPPVAPPPQGPPRPLMNTNYQQQQPSMPQMNMQMQPPMMTNTAPPGMSAPPPLIPNMRPPGMQVNQQPPGMMQMQQMPQMGQMGQMNQMPPMAQMGMQNLGAVRIGLPSNGPPGIMPGAHINPQVYPGYQQMGMQQHPMMQRPEGPTNDAEFEEIMSRNRTVSSSAISRAVSDASSGDIEGAIETLLTAISLIKSSKVSYDDRCKQLVTSLQDTLAGIETKGSSRLVTVSAIVVRVAAAGTTVVIDSCAIDCVVELNMCRFLSLLSPRPSLTPLRRPTHLSAS
ncbi:unnamed protein product, partial [Mesorhabditis spiculigera]